MNTTILQIPINKSLRDKATVVASKIGFSSLQETVRVFLSQLVLEEVSIRFEPKSVRLSSYNVRHFAKMVDQVKTGKVKTKKFSDVNSLMNYLAK